MNSKFNWFERDIDAEIEEFDQKDITQSTFSKVFDYLYEKIYIVITFLIVMSIIWFVFDIPSGKIFVVDFLIIFDSFYVMTGSLSIIVAVTKILTYDFLNIGLDSKIEALLAAYRLFALIIRCIVNLSWFKPIKDDIIDQYFVIRAILSSILITSIAYSITSVLMIV